MSARLKLSDAQAWEIFQLSWYGEVEQKWICERYGITQSVVSNIKHGWQRIRATQPYSQVHHPLYQ